MKLTYYIDRENNDKLCCRISDGVDSLSFSLEYTIDPEKWDSRNEESRNEDPYHHVFLQYRLYLNRRYHELLQLRNSAADVLIILRDEAEILIHESGIDGIVRKMFDDANQQHALPPYSQFIQAFEQFSGLGRMEYDVKVVSNTVEFHSISGMVWEMDTRKGLTARLQELVEGRFLHELSADTNRSSWSRIYANTSIEKHVFIPKFLTEWERFWDEEYADLQQKIGTTSHLNEMRQVSWRYFQVFMNCYDSTRNSIELAYEISENDLYPLAVITLLQLLGADTCYTAYCALEFGPDSGWTSVTLGSDKVGTGCEANTEDIVQMPAFFIREIKL